MDSQVLNNISEILEIFEKEEREAMYNEFIENIEKLRKDPCNKIKAHSLKGCSNMLGITNIGEIAKKIEKEELDATPFFNEIDLIVVYLKNNNLFNIWFNTYRA